jgi:hypothetical protein
MKPTRCEHCLLPFEPDDSGVQCPRCSKLLCRYCLSWQERTNFCANSKSKRPRTKKRIYLQRVRVETPEDSVTEFLRNVETLLGTELLNDDHS